MNTHKWYKYILYKNAVQFENSFIQEFVQGNWYQHNAPSMLSFSEFHRVVILVSADISLMSSSNRPAALMVIDHRYLWRKIAESDRGLILLLQLRE